MGQKLELLRKTTAGHDKELVLIRGKFEDMEHGDLELELAYRSLVDCCRSGIAEFLQPISLGCRCLSLHDIRWLSKKHRHPIRRYRRLSLHDYRAAALLCMFIRPLSFFERLQLTSLCTRPPFWRLPIEWRPQHVFQQLPMSLRRMAHFGLLRVTLAWSSSFF